MCVCVRERERERERACDTGGHAVGMLQLSLWKDLFVKV